MRIAVATLCLCLAVGHAAAQANAPLISGLSGGWRQVSTCTSCCNPYVTARLCTYRSAMAYSADGSAQLCIMRPFCQLVQCICIIGTIIQQSVRRSDTGTHSKSDNGLCHVSPESEHLPLAIFGYTPYQCLSNNGTACSVSSY